MSYFTYKLSKHLLHASIIAIYNLYLYFRYKKSKYCNICIQSVVYSIRWCGSNNILFNMILIKLFLCYQLLKAARIHFLNNRSFMVHLLSGTNWMVVLEKIIFLTHLNVKLTLFLSYFDLYNIVLACCWYHCLFYYYVVFILTWDNGTAFIVYWICRLLNLKKIFIIIATTTTTTTTIIIIIIIIVSAIILSFGNIYNLVILNITYAIIMCLPGSIVEYWRNISRMMSYWTW